MKDKNEKNGNGTVYAPIFMCLGLSVGMCLGIASDNMALGMCLGLSVGLCLGSAVDASNRKKRDEEVTGDEEA